MYVITKNVMEVRVYTLYHKTICQWILNDLISDIVCASHSEGRSLGPSWGDVALGGSAGAGDEMGSDSHHVCHRSLPPSLRMQCQASALCLWNRGGLVAMATALRKRVCACCAQCAAWPVSALWLMQHHIFQLMEFVITAFVFFFF